MSTLKNSLTDGANNIDGDTFVVEGNTVGIEPSEVVIEPSEVVIELETLSPEERQSILMETANSTDTESVREAIQEALQLIEDKQNEQRSDVVQSSSDFVQRVQTAREHSLPTTDVPSPPTAK